MGSPGSVSCSIPRRVPPARREPLPPSAGSSLIFCSANAFVRAVVCLRAPLSPAGICLFPGPARLILRRESATQRGLLTRGARLGWCVTGPTLTSSVGDLQGPRRWVCGGGGGGIVLKLRNRVESRAAQGACAGSCGLRRGGRGVDVLFMRILICSDCCRDHGRGRERRVQGRGGGWVPAAQPGPSQQGVCRIGGASRRGLRRAGVACESRPCAPATPPTAAPPSSPPQLDAPSPERARSVLTRGSS